MNQSYGRLVSRAAIAATVMASCLLIIKIFAWWYTGSVSILAALVDSLVDIAASLTNLLVVRYSLQRNRRMKSIRLATAKRNRWPRWHKACLFRALRFSCF
ncbi:cation-efflux pump fieF [Enterobacter hormaechei]|nr:cation-efflux pump fieF [Enterobacter hormaechei]